MTHVVWKRAKNTSIVDLLERGDCYNAIDFLDPKNRVIAALDCMSTDALTTLGARASAGMVFITKGGIFRLQHEKS